MRNAVIHRRQDVEATRPDGRFSPTADASFDAIVRRAQAARVPSVSAAVWGRGHGVWTGAVGMADVGTGTPATPATQYRVGSVTKVFTAVATMTLAQRGELELDDRVSRHLGLRSGATGDVSIRQLLTHLAGLPRRLPRDVGPPDRSASVEELLSALHRLAAVVKPNTVLHYSNVGYAVLGEIVHRVAGMPYREYVDQHVIRPLGLSRTGWSPEPPAAVGYFVEPHADRVHVEPQHDFASFAAAGQLWSTADDLCRLGGFLIDGRPDVLPADVVGEMWLPRTILDQDTWTAAWGLGLILRREGDRVLAGHTGMVEGFQAAVYADRKRGISAAALLNASAPGDPDALARQLCDSAAAAVAVAPQPTRWLSDSRLPEGLSSVLGSWWCDGMEFVFEWRDGLLRARSRALVDGSQESVFEAVEPDVFRTASGSELGELVHVDRDRHGEAERIWWATYVLSRDPLSLTCEAQSEETR